MPISFITHKGKEILYCDFRNLNTDEKLIENLELVVKFLRESPETSSFLVLTDYRGSNVGSDFMESAKKYGKEIMNQKTEKGAILGIFGIKKILLKAYTRFSGENLIPFDSEEEAKDYLVS